MRDPYLEWAELSGYRDVACDPAGRVGVIIECAGTVADLQQAIDDGSLPGVQMPALYRGGVLDARELHYCTAWVQRAHLRSLAARVKRFKLGMAIEGYEAPAASAPPQHCSGRVVVGLIDDFVAFAHPNFADAQGRSRVRFVWNQDAKAPDAANAGLWKPAAGVGYGHELASAGVLTEQLAGAYPRVLPRRTHGTHVADLAAGQRADDGATAPDIVAVHLPRRGVDDTSGSALKMQALDAMHYVIQRAGPQAAMVINMSYGTMAGAHDGRSILELAIDELIELLQGRLQVVLPAGNDYRSRCHAVVRLSSGQPKQKLHWKVLPDDATPSFVELWLPGKSAARIKARVTDPSGRSSGWCGVGEVYPKRGRSAAPVDFALIFLDAVADSPRGSMILVALAATAGAHRSRSPAGEWCVELSIRGAGAPVTVHAWIERDDTLRGRPPRGRQSVFLDTPAKQVQPPGSFNSIANGLQAVVVGGFVASTQEVAPYSGGGPTRGPRRGPTLLAPSDESPTLHGLLAAGTAPADKVRMDGTSVAAPQVARRLAHALAMSKQPGPPRLTPQEVIDALLPQVRGTPQVEADARRGLGLLRPNAPFTNASAAGAGAPRPTAKPRHSRRRPDPSSAG